MSKIFYKEKIADKRIIHLCGLKFTYKKKYDIKSIDKDKVQKQIDEFLSNGLNTHQRDEKLIVSLTSFPQRMYDIHFTLYSLLTQTLKPDMVILWLGEDKFPNREKDLPKDVIKLMNNGLTVKFCRDIRSYTKLIPSLKEFSDAVIVTADDDIYYEKNWLEGLYNSYLKDKQSIHCHRANGITVKNNEINSDKKWIEPNKMNSSGSSFRHFLTGVGGVLYPPNCLYKDVLDEDKFMQLAPRHDDAWFWAMAVMNDTKINVINNNINKLTFVNPERELQFNGETTLWSQNKNEGNSQITKILEYYPDIKNKILNGVNI